MLFTTWSDDVITSRNNQGKPRTPFATAVSVWWFITAPAKWACLHPNNHFHLAHHLQKVWVVQEQPEDSHSSMATTRPRILWALEDKTYTWSNFWYCYYLGTETIWPTLRCSRQQLCGFVLFTFTVHCVAYPNLEKQRVPESRWCWEFLLDETYTWYLFW